MGSLGSPSGTLRLARHRGIACVLATTQIRHGQEAGLALGAR